MIIDETGIGESPMNTDNFLNDVLPLATSLKQNLELAAKLHDAKVKDVIRPRHGRARLQSKGYMRIQFKKNQRGATGMDS